MKHVLVAERAEELCSALSGALRKEYRVTTCSTTEDALDLLRITRPDILILDLGLPGDGLRVLQDAGDALPRLILATATFCAPYVEQSLQDYGVSYLLRKPCRVNAIISRIADMVRRAEQPASSVLDHQSVVAAHLQRLGMQTARGGYRQLRIGIPLYAQDPEQRLSKELYPAISSLCACEDSRAIERSIRRAIQNAWVSGDPKVWADYFPPAIYKSSACPSNKDFIARIAELLIETA